MLKICPYLQQTCHLYDDFSHNLYAPPLKKKKRPFYRSRSFCFCLEKKITCHSKSRITISLPSIIPISTRLLAFVAKILITELSPKHETNVYDLTTLFVPFLLPPISRVFFFFFSFILFLSILTPKIKCVNPFNYF